MTRMSLEDYRLNYEDHKYPVSIASDPDVIDAFMIEFDQPAFLAGPFGGKFGLLTIRDKRKGTRELKTQTEHFNSMRAYFANSIYNMPHAKDGQACITTDHEYLMGRYHKETYQPAPMEDKTAKLFFMTKNTLPGSSTLEHPFLERRLANDSTVDGLDMLRLFKSMIETLSPEEILKRIEQSELKIQNRLATYLAHEADAVPTIERPISLCLQGNDDSSWSKVFATIDEAFAYADEIELSARKAGLPKGLMFTN
jgi:hypothetical protein